VSTLQEKTDTFKHNDKTCSFYFSFHKEKSLGELKFGNSPS